MAEFDRFVGIDWSGARGKSHKGLAVACTGGDGLVNLVHPPMGTHWSRGDIAAWVMGLLSMPGRSLVAIDASFSAPYADEGSFLPDETWASAQQLWRAVADLCADADFYAGGFVEHFTRFFHRPGSKGDAFKRRLRICEDLCVAEGLGSAESLFHLIGPSQVGLSSLSVMRLLASLAEKEDVAIWPFQAIAGKRLVLVEAFATQCVRLAGIKGKIRETGPLLDMVTKLGGTLSSDQVRAFETLPERDHMADAVAMALGARKMANIGHCWQPKAMTPSIAQTEGWTFGVGCGLNGG